jgi:hypothetical protein
VNAPARTPGQAAHDTWCADDDWGKLSADERALWEDAAKAAIAARQPPAPELAAAMRENRILRDSLAEAVEIARIDPPRSAAGKRARKANLDNIAKRCGMPS